MRINRGPQNRKSVTVLEEVKKTAAVIFSSTIT